MITETGVIEKVEEGWAWVVTQRISVCAHFSSKKHRRTMNSENRVMIKVRNPAGAVPGDKVELYINTTTKIKLLILLYIIPATGLLIGAFSADFLSHVMRLNPILGTFIFAATGFAITLNGVRFVFNHITSKTDLAPFISRVVFRYSTGVIPRIGGLLNQSVGWQRPIPNWMRKTWAEPPSKTIDEGWQK